MTDRSGADAPHEGPTTVHLPPPGGRLGRLVLAGTILLVGLLQVAVGIQAERTTTVVIGAVVLLVAISLARRTDQGVHLGTGGVSIPGWPRGADVPWSQVERLVEQPLPAGLVRVRLGRADHPGATTRVLATLTPSQAERLLPQVRELARTRGIPVVDPAGDPVGDGPAG